MGHSYISNLVHYVFSTEGRQKLITPDLEERLWPYMAGIARKNKMKTLSIGGMSDHIHMLVSLPSMMSMAKGVQLIKGGSSKWVHDTFREHSKFGWQEGYGGFSIGISQVQTTVEYIQNQKEHHKKKDFKQEFLSFLKKHDVEYDPRYIWD
jgi:putative transposase